MFISLRTKKYVVNALAIVMLLLLAGCLVGDEEPAPATMLALEDEISIEDNPKLFAEYESVVSKIYVKTGADKQNSQAGQNITGIILETLHLMEIEGIRMTALELAKELVSNMPNDTKTYDLLEVSKTYFQPPDFPGD